MGDTWQPLSITTLDCSDADLFSFDVTGMVNLRALNLSGNRLTRISDGGLVTCTALTSLDISHNKISIKEELLPLKFMPSLVKLAVQGNPACSSSHFREFVIANLQCLPGTPKLRGLQWLDGDITMDERVAAGTRFLNYRKQEYRVELIMTRIFGQKNVGRAGVVDASLKAMIKVIRLSDCGLDKLPRMDWSEFTGVEELNLVRNGLKKVIGLDKMTNLRILNLQANRSSLVDHAVKQLQTLTSLVKVQLADDAEKAVNPKHLRKLRERLVPSNGRLRQIENEVISIDDRTAILKVGSAQLSRARVPVQGLTWLHGVGCCRNRCAGATTKL